ncbi:MAG TPA: type II secretion system minor pseudopilin GspJ [Nevskiaceae bacterium]|nr:type II secretion system minor pseudopilin GspJ [Nevskiaceae bacterium]
MRQRAAGFTLLELIVVVGVFAVMSIMAYGGLDSVLDTRRAVEASLDQTARLQKAYLRLRGDFQNLAARPVRDGFGDLQPALFGAEREGVEFTRGGWRNPLSQPRPSLERVRYRLEDGELVRESWRVLDRAQDSEPVRLVLLEEIDALRLRYLDDQDQWQERWPAEGGSGRLSPEQADAAPPRAVELTLEIARLGEVRLLFRADLAPAPVTLESSPGGGEDRCLTEPDLPECKPPPPQDPDED